MVDELVLAVDRSRGITVVSVQSDGGEHSYEIRRAGARLALVHSIEQVGLALRAIAGQAH